MLIGMKNHLKYSEKYGIDSGVLKVDGENSIKKLLAEDNESLKIF